MAVSLQGPFSAGQHARGASTFTFNILKTDEEYSLRGPIPGDVIFLEVMKPKMIVSGPSGWNTQPAEDIGNPIFWKVWNRADNPFVTFAVNDGCPYLWEVRVLVVSP